MIGMLSGAVFAFCLKEKIVETRHVGVGAASIFLIFGTFSWTMGIETWISRSIFALVAFAGIYLIATRRVFVAIENLGTLILSNTLSVLLVLNGKVAHQYYVNPDPYGFSSIVGALRRFDSARDLLNEWRQLTGESYNFSKSWDLPTPLLDSPWLITDQTIRYSVDSISRLGIPATFESVISEQSSPSTFFTFWLALGIVSVSLFVFSLVSISSRSNYSFSENSNKKGESHALSQISLRKLNTYKILLACLFTSLVINSLVIEIFLLEGLIAQLVSNVFIISLVDFFFSTEKEKSRFAASKLVVISSIFLGSVTIVYVTYTPVVLAVLVALILSRGLVWTFSSLLRKFCYLIVMMPILFLSTKLPLVGLHISQIGNASGHGSVHLGAPSLTQFSGLAPNELPKRIQPVQGVKIEQLFVDTLNSNAGLPGSALGFELFQNSLFTLASQLLLLTLIWLVFASYLIRKRVFTQSQLALWALTFPLILLQLWYLYSSVYLPFRNFLDGEVVETVYNDYVFLRLNGFLFPFSLISIALLLTVITQRKVFHSKKFLSFAAGILIFALFGFASASKAHNNQSIDSSIVKSCKELEAFDNPIFVWFPRFEQGVITSLTFCNKPVESFTDSFPVLIPASGQTRDVVEIIWDQSTRTWSIKLVGVINLTKPVQTPCDITCLRTLSEFKPLE
jgi:hypothetical protein